MFHTDIFFIASEITVDNHSEEVNWFLWESHWQGFNQKGLIFPEKKKKAGGGGGQKRKFNCNPVKNLQPLFWFFWLGTGLSHSTIWDALAFMSSDKWLTVVPHCLLLIQFLECALIEHYILWEKKKKVQSQLFLLSVHHLNTKKHDLKRKKKIFMLISIYTLSCTQVLQRNLLRALW